jgi:hypothetical protein
VSSHELGYVVITWNQASHWPGMDSGYFYDEADDAHAAARSMRAATKEVGRGERHTVHAVLSEEIDDPEAVADVY